VTNVKHTLRRALAALLALFVVTLPLGSALAAAPHGAPAAVHAEAEEGAEAHGAADAHAGAAAHGEHGSCAAHGKTRPCAAEDHHWWLGKELIPVSVREQLAEVLGTQFIFGDTPQQVDVGHIFMALIVFFIGIGLALAARRKMAGQVLPPRTLGAAALFDIVMDALMGIMESMMPRERALKYLPLMTSIAIFILLSNLLGLIPGFMPPTSNLNTTFALGALAFLFYNYQGIKAQGLVNYVKHFMGPIPALAPLMLPIELVSHFVRPLSLAIRLAGNMFGDHQVVFVFLSFAIPLIPLPIMALGLLVCLIQTVVFTMLFIVYVALATAHHDHEDHAHHAEGAGHGHDHGAHAHAH